MEKLFGTDGIRGKSGKYPINTETAYNIGNAISLLNNKNKDKKLCLIAYDTRLSSMPLALALASSLSSNNINVDICGEIPTPALSLAMKKSKADFGIMITASHNPFEDNGFKIFSSSGEKISTITQEKLEKLIHKRVNKSSETYSKISITKKYKNLYENKLIKEFKKKLKSNKLKIVIDGANGAASKTIRKVFKKLNLNFSTINCSPNGTNINFNCGCTHLDSIINEVKKNKADIGIAVDGDGDRIYFIDEKEGILDGDNILSIFYKYMNKNNKLKNNILVSTIISTVALDKVINKNHGKVVRTDVGDPKVLGKLKEINSNIGGEQSGHIILLDHLPVSDGIYCALKMILILTKTKKKLSQLKKILPNYPKIHKNLNVKNKLPINSLKSYKLIKEIQNNLGEDGNFIIRYSGTENLLRLFIEGENKKVISDHINFISKEILNEIG